MSSSELRVVPDSLRRVARIWDQQATVIGSITPQVDAMSFGRLEAGVFQLIVSPYDAVVQSVAQRCAEGKTEMEKIASALLANAKNYVATDAKLTASNELLAGGDPT
jgi:hypothetical protein